MPNLNTSEAVRAAVGSLPNHKLAKDTTRCPLCLQPVEEEGGLGGGGVPDEMEWLDEMGGDGDPLPLSGRPTKSARRIAVILGALRQYPLLNRAARLGGVKPRTLQRWRHDDPELRAAVEEAIDEGIERLELRAHEDAVEGTDREATLQRMFTIKRWRPEYRDNVTVHHQGGGQDARDAALLRRAMVEALGPYPEARAALAATLARLGGVTSETSSPALPASRPGEEETPRAPDDDVVDAELVTVEPAIGSQAAGSSSGSRAGSEARAGGRREESGASTRGGGGARASVGPVLSASPSSTPIKGVGLFDRAVVNPHIEDDD